MVSNRAFVVLEIVDTNSGGRRSGGETMGFSGKEVFPVLLSIFPSLVLFVMVGFGASNPFILIICFTPTIGTTVFVMFFVHGKPPGYISDNVETLVKGRDFVAKNTQDRRNPHNGRMS